MKVQLQINRQAHTLHSHRVLVTEHTHQSHSSYTQVSNSHFTIDISMSMSSDSKAHSSLLGLMLPFSLYNPVLQLKAVADGHHHHSSVHQNHHRLFSHQILASASLANASASNVALHSALHLPASLHHASLAALRHPHLSPLTNSTSSVHSSSSPSVSPALASPPPALNFPFGHPPSQSHSPKSHHNLHHQGRLKFSIDNILSPTFGGNGLPLVKESLGGALDGDASRSPSSSPTSSISSSKVRLLKSPSQLSTKCTSNATISTPSTSSTTSTNCKATTVSSSGGGPGPHALTRRKYSSDSESSNSSAASTGLSLKKSPKKEPNSSTTNTTSTSASSSSSSSSAAGSVASSSTPGVNGKQAPSSSSSSSSSSSEYYATDESVKDPNKNPSLTFPLDGKDPIVWPAWVYCTRYSDRPSSGPRSRRVKKKEKKADEKRPRTAFTAEQLQRLKQEFQENRYLTEKRRQDLARDLKLNESQIKIWFQNKRAKIKKTTGQRNPLALHLMAQGLYNHSTASVSGDDDEDEMIDVDRPNSVASTNGGNVSGGGHQQSSNQITSTSLSSPEASMADHSMSSDQ